MVASSGAPDNSDKYGVEVSTDRLSSLNRGSDILGTGHVAFLSSPVNLHFSGQTAEN
jgi:hypothetical protein